MNKKEVIEGVIKETEKQIIQSELTEKYIQRRVIQGMNKLELPLGKLQTDIKEKKKWLEFLNEELKDNS